MTTMPEVNGLIRLVGYFQIYLDLWFLLSLMC